MDEDDDFDDEQEVEVAPVAVKPKEPGVSNRLPDIPEGKAECYWCPRELPKDKMKKMRVHDSIVYVCDRCG